MSKKSEDDRAWMLEALDEEERVEHGLPEQQRKPTLEISNPAVSLKDGERTRKDQGETS